MLLLQRTRELLLDCRGVAEQLSDSPAGHEPQAGAAERIAYGVLVAALEEGLVTTLQHAMEVLQRFSAPAGPWASNGSASRRRSCGEARMRGAILSKVTTSGYVDAVRSATST